MNISLGSMIEALVAILLMLTIGYCALLNKRLKRLKADEQTLKATISELITVTEIAERAVAGLKLTVRDCDHELGERLRNAQTLSAEIASQLSDGQSILDKLTQITLAARSPAEPSQREPRLPDARATAVAAQAFAARARLRSTGAAA